MTRFRADVVFLFDAPSMRDGGRRLRELQEAVRGTGFELRSGTVREARPEDEASNETTYAPLGEVSREQDATAD